MEKEFATEPSLTFRMKKWTNKRNESGDHEDGEEDDDELPCVNSVIGESEGDCVLTRLAKISGEFIT